MPEFFSMLHNNKLSMKLCGANGPFEKMEKQIDGRFQKVHCCLGKREGGIHDIKA